jgi:hypothetical protein
VTAGGERERSKERREPPFRSFLRYWDTFLSSVSPRGMALCEESKTIFSKNTTIIVDTLSYRDKLLA